MADEKHTTATAWKPGQSGNPGGRKPGAELVRLLLEPKRKELIDKAVSMALAGDSTALRICIDRLAPPPRAESPSVVIAGLADGATLTDKANAILAAAGRGDLSPDAASTLLQAMAAACKVAEFDDFEKRIDALESKGGRP